MLPRKDTRAGNAEGGEAGAPSARAAAAQAMRPTPPGLPVACRVPLPASPRASPSPAAGPPRDGGFRPGTSSVRQTALQRGSLPPKHLRRALPTPARHAEVPHPPANHQRNSKAEKAGLEGPAAEVGSPAIPIKREENPREPAEGAPSPLSSQGQRPRGKRSLPPGSELQNISVWWGEEQGCYRKQTFAVKTVT